LIAEKFYYSDTPVSKESALLLYSAIISNTINFQSQVTTSRDQNMASWLKDKIKIPQNYINEMFKAKSNFKYLLKKTIFDECAIFNINNQKIGISQLEIVNANLFVKENITNIKAILSSIKTSKSLDIIFLSLIDLKHAFNIFIVIDQTSQNLIEKILKLQFKNSISKTEHIIMRKEIIPLIREYFQN
jgi:inorganic pyrophosphatase/exopolyphosphatase